MPVLLLLRDTPLNESEARRLPTGCYPVFDSKDRIVARAEITGPLPMLLFMVAKMVKAVPDSDFGYEAGFDEELSEESSTYDSVYSDSESESESQSASEHDVAAHEDAPEEWKILLDTGRVDEALESFLATGKKLSFQDTQSLLSSQQSHNIIFICKIACFHQLQPLVLKLRRSLQHPDPEVKIAVLNTYGQLADFSIAPSIHLFLADANEKIRMAAIRAFQSIQEREEQSTKNKKSPI